MRGHLPAFVALALVATSGPASSADGSSTDLKLLKPDLDVYADKGLIGISNPSDAAIEFHWQLRAGDSLCRSQDARQIGPKGQIYLTCELSPAPTLLQAGFLKPEKRPGVLRIAESADDARSEQACAKCRDHLVAITIGYFSEAQQAALNVLTLLTLLIAGGFFSHWIATTLPNLRQRKRLKARVDRLRWDISWRATDLDNDLPSRLATDRSRLADQLSGLPAWGNDTADTLTEVDQSLGLLEQRAALFGRIVTVRERLKRAAVTEFRRAEIDRAIRALLLKMAADDDGDRLGSLAGELATFAGTSEAVDEAFEEWCSAREAKLAKVAQTVAADPEFKAMAAACAAISSPLRPLDYAARELAVRQLALIERFQALSAAPSQAEHVAWIADVLAAKAVPSLKKPARRLTELESGITAVEAASALDAAAIRVRPATPLAFEPVVIEFRPSDDKATVLQNFETEGLLVAQWAFYGPPKKNDSKQGGAKAASPRFRASGSMVRCYFPEPGTHTIELSLGGTAVRKSITVGRSRARVTAQFGLQAARLVGTQLLAAAAALATAWDKLASTDVVVAVVAALAVGYGADTFKSVGAAIVGKVTGTDATAIEKKEAFANASAALDE
jgi:hypothetical protein